MIQTQTGSDVFRVSVSSTAPSTSSSHGSAPDDCDSLGDVYIWGEVICPEINATSVNLLPRLLESNVVLDVHHIACGAKHAALVTKQGEVFTWGHTFPNAITQPRLVESLTFANVNFVSCGEFHTCAVTKAGELYTWGNYHDHDGTGVSHWIPKRISGPLEGLQVTTVTCGVWHTALITSTGQLFTFGDGTFGVLGHGNRESVSYPREVESLSGLRTVDVSCGVWHTAAVVEVIASFTSGKLFTWGDGDKNRLGHGDKETRLEPTCVPSLIDHDFRKTACGHSLTVGLTTSGQVFAMGSSVYGQLGNRESDGKLPCLVELETESVEEISCGSYHVAVLTSKNEVYTWGRGANGRLGHGDVEDRKTPTLVEALKDRHVKFVSCGSNYTSVICIHKWVSGAGQSQCVACRLAFGFTRKRHNCYNCGLVHCHACSSRKAPLAALAPNPVKPHRVCDLCFAKLSKVPSNFDLIKQLDTKAEKRGKKGFTKTTSSVSTRPVSPFSRKPSPQRSVTPVPTMSGLSFSKNITDSLKKTNELLNQELHKLRVQVQSLKSRCELQESELQKSAKKTQEAMVLAAEESAKCKAAKDVIKSLTAQLKDMAERMPPGAYDPESLKMAHLPNGMEPNGTHSTYRSSVSESGSYQDSENGLRSRNSIVPSNAASHIEAEWIEQYEPGVYITLVALRDGTRDLKRVRFSRRRFGEHQAETWWSENREKVYEKYNVRGSDKSSVSGQAARRSEGALSPSSQILGKNTLY